MNEPLLLLKRETHIRLLTLIHSVPSTLSPGLSPDRGGQLPGPLDSCSQVWEHQSVTVAGEKVVTDFAKKHAQSRKPLARFLAVAHEAEWKHMAEIKETLSGTDFDPDTQSYIFNISGNKYRLIAFINFEKQTMLVDTVMTHEEYNKRK